MIRVRPVGRLALFLALGGTSPCHAATEEAKAPDYLEWRLLNRNYFLYNDYRRADARRGYRKEWAHGLIADLESAYTPAASVSASISTASPASSSTADVAMPAPACCRWTHPAITPASIPTPAPHSSCGSARVCSRSAR